MILQFIEIGIYKRNEYEPPHDIVYDVIVGGEVVKTCKYRGTALIEMAGHLDKLIEPGRYDAAESET